MIPLINILMLVTNRLHFLFFTSLTIEPLRTHFQYFANFGLFIWIHTAFAYTVTLASIALLYYEFITTSRQLKPQLLWIIAGSISPMLFNVVFLLDKNSAQYDFTPFSLLTSVLLFGYAINRYQFIKGTPISRKLTLHSIQDSVLILEDEGMIVEFNAAFEKEFELISDFRFHPSKVLPLKIQRILTLTAHQTYYDLQIRVADEESNLSYYKVKKIPAIEKNTQFYIYLMSDRNTTSILLKTVEQKQTVLNSIRDNNLKFLSSISHELRAPLNTLKSVAELLIEKSMWGSEELNQLTRLTNGLHHKTNLILDYAKIEANEMKPKVIDIPYDQVVDLLLSNPLNSLGIWDAPTYLASQNTLLPLIEHMVHA